MTSSGVPFAASSALRESWRLRTHDLEASCRLARTALDACTDDPRGTLATWDDLFTKAAYFATEVGPGRVLNISHSVDDADGVVTVWYWEPKEDAADAAPSASETSSPSP